MDISKCFVEITIFIVEDFKYDDSVKFWGCIGAKAVPLYVEFCNFVQCIILVNYKTLSICPYVSPLKTPEPNGSMLLHNISFK
jgi:hypothetical protein